MDKLSKSLEVLKLLSNTTSETLTTSNEKYAYLILCFLSSDFNLFVHSFSLSLFRSRLDPVSLSKEKIFHLNNITELLSSPALIK